VKLPEGVEEIRITDLRLKASDSSLRSAEVGGSCKKFANGDTLRGGFEPVNNLFLEALETENGED
jgi:hypothetical protein